MLPTLEAPELIFGLCSPLGTTNKKISEIISNVLLTYNYKTTPFKVTGLMKSIVLPGLTLSETPITTRYDSYIKYANKLREEFEDPSILAVLCLGAVRAHRRQVGKKSNSYLPGNAYIFDQFKRKEEIELLRQVYGRLFIAVSIYSDKEIRINDLKQKIASDASASRPELDHENQAKRLLVRDEDEEGEPHGQRLREAFPLADVFVDIDNIEESTAVLTRFLRSLFGANNISPTKDEYGMYFAKTASLRSLDLSRQVGAAIFSAEGEVLTLGSNEVPKSGGGTYWTSDHNDSRDYTIGRDENERIKRALLVDVVRRLVEGKFLQAQKSESEIVTYVMNEAVRKGSLLRDALVMDLLEFGRVIHAEMSAICDAARLGKTIRDTVLYCTTFPCHICAKHIVASGISRVVYIEPYPKSYAEHISSSVEVCAGDYSGEKIQFAPFIGISPLRFRDCFERGRRKDERGEFQEWITGKPRVNVKYTLATYLQNEAALTKLWERKVETLEAASRIFLRGKDVARSTV